MMNVCLNHLIGLVIIFLITLYALVVSINNREKNDE